MTHAEAEALVARVRRETSLEAVVVDESDGGFRVDIPLPRVRDEVEATASVDDADNWEWIRDRHVLPRLSPDAL